MRCQQLHVGITAQYAFGDCEAYARMGVGERLFEQMRQKMVLTPRLDRTVCAVSTTYQLVS